MTKVDLSLQARLDLLSIIEYVADARTARTYDSDLERLIERLSAFRNITPELIARGRRP